MQFHGYSKTSRRLAMRILRPFHRNSYLCRKYSGLPSQSITLWCGNVVFGEGQLAPGSVELRDGVIVKCRPNESWKEANGRQKVGYTILNLGEEMVLSPGMIDVHTHISALGRNWEGYTSATQAAAAGGITTIFGMPLNSIPSTTSLDAVELEKDAASKSKMYVDVGLWGGVIPENSDESKLSALLASPFIFGIKAFLAPLPPTAGYEAIAPSTLMDAAKLCGLADKPVLVHSELMTPEEISDLSQKAFQERLVGSYEAHLASRPALWEQRAITVVCDAAKHCHMHIVHLSDATESVKIIRQTENRANLTVETCPHYLLLDETQVEDGDTRLKCFPPLRSAENRQQLWEALLDGTIDMLASDHSPCEDKLRTPGNFQVAWGGLTGLQYQLQASWTEASTKFNCTPLDMAKWWSWEPSKLAGVDSKKGSIVEGKQADLCWWDPNFCGAPSTTSKEYHRWKGACYYTDNEDMCGRILGTWVNGYQVYNGLDDNHGAPAGKLLRLDDL